MINKADIKGYNKLVQIATHPKMYNVSMSHEDLTKVVLSLMQDIGRLEKKVKFLEKQL